MQPGVVVDDRDGVGGQPDVHLHAVGAAAQGPLHRGEGVLRRGGGRGAPMTQQLHVLTVGNRNVGGASAGRRVGGEQVNVLTAGGWAGALLQPGCAAGPARAG